MAKRLVYGVGINDADYSVVIYGNTDNGKRIIWKCPYYRAWNSMLERCYSNKVHERHPTYSECFVSEEWKYFSNFKLWMSSQNWYGKHLDKDILVFGNKEYSKETCVFVAPEVNKFLADSGAIRGQYPIGVYFHKASQRFHARCCNKEKGKHESLGFFRTPEAAHEAWRRRKHQLACAYADIQEDQRVADALRKRYAAKVEII